MTQTTNTIEINGKRYDTRTGKLLQAVQPRYSVSTGNSIDGFVQPPQRTAAIASSAKTIHTAFTPQTVAEEEFLIGRIVIVCSMGRRTTGLCVGDTTPNRLILLLRGIS